MGQGEPQLVYLVKHAHFDPALDGGRDDKLIGVFDSVTRARAAIAQVSEQPGFFDHPDGFSIDCFVVGSLRGSSEVKV